MRDTTIKTVGKIYTTRRMYLHTPDGKQLILVADSSDNVYVDLSGIYTACGYYQKHGKAYIRKGAILTQIVESLNIPVRKVVPGQGHFMAIPASCVAMALEAFVQIPPEKIRLLFRKNFTDTYRPHAARLLEWWNANGHFIAKTFCENLDACEQQITSKEGETENMTTENMTTGNVTTENISAAIADIANNIVVTAKEFVSVGMPKDEAISYAVKICAKKSHVKLDALATLIIFAKEVPAK